VADSNLPNLVHRYSTDPPPSLIMKCMHADDVFIAGMCLLDTTDGALMMTLYTSTALARDQIAVLYYSIVLTVITIVVAIVIGVLQLLSLILNVAEPEGRFWDGVAVAQDYYDGSFVFSVSFFFSFLLFHSIQAVSSESCQTSIIKKPQKQEVLQLQNHVQILLKNTSC
jgi:high-affinity nickel-transport protein